MRILYGTDGSKGSVAGAHLLARLPLPADWEVTILTVLPEDEAPGVEAAQAAAREVLRGTAASVRPEARRGNPAEEILRAAEEIPADLVVVGSRGRTGLARFLLGSVAERVARHALRPVALARPLVNDLRQVILGIDGSESALRAAEWLRRFPLPEGCEVRITTVMPYLEAITPSRRRNWPAAFVELYEEEFREARERLAGLVASFSEAGKRSVPDMRSGDPAETLLRVAEEEKVDLIVLGGCGTSALERFLLGSVCEKVLRHADCSVLVVK